LALFFSVCDPFLGHYPPDKTCSKCIVFDYFFNSYHSNPKFLYSAASVVLKQTPMGLDTGCGVRFQRNVYSCFSKNDSGLFWARYLGAPAAARKKRRRIVYWVIVS